MATDYFGTFVTGLSDQAGAGDRYLANTGWSLNALANRILPPQAPTGKLFPVITDLKLGVDDPTPVKSSVPGLDFAGFLVDETPHLLWFEHVWSKPQRIDLGNMLTTITREIEIYNAYREADRTVNSVTNNAGPGISFIGLPGLPDTIVQQHSLIFDVQISTAGPPDIDGTIDIDMDTPDISIPITGTRVVMFPYAPESPLAEILEFKTSILMAADGSESRANLRKHPRQNFQFTIRVEEDEERRRLEALLFTWHPRVFGVPVWFEAKVLGADALINDTVITVDTKFADFRAGGLAIVWDDYMTFDALEIDSLTDTTLTFSSPVTHDFNAGQTLVIPLRVGITERTINVVRQLNSMEDISLSFLIEDNETNFADTSSFNTHNSKVMLDDGNVVAGTTIRDNIEQQTMRIDNMTGKPVQFSDWPRGQYITRKGFVTHDHEGLWRVRQLVHALRGSQVSFYLPTFYRDIVVKADLASGSVLMDIEHIGYTDFVGGDEPNKSLWIELNDSTILTRQVDSSAELDATTERLTVDSSWASTILVGDIRRVSFLRLSRIADDKVSFLHDHGGSAQIGFPVRGVRQ